MPVKAEITGDNPQPGSKAATPVRLEFQQATEAVPRKLLANMKEAIGSVILIVAVCAGSLVENRAVLPQEGFPRCRPSRRARPCLQGHGAGIATFSPPTGG